MSKLQRNWQDYASPTQLLDYFACGLGKYAFPIMLSPLVYATISNPIGMEIIYDISITDVAGALLASHLGHSFFRAATKRKASDRAEAHAQSTPWHREPIKKSSFLRAFVQDIFSLPRPVREYKEQKFAYRYDAHMNKLRRDAERQYSEEVKSKTEPMPRPMSGRRP